MHRRPRTRNAILDGQATVPRLAAARHPKTSRDFLPAGPVAGGDADHLVEHRRRRHRPQHRHHPHVDRHAVAMRRQQLVAEEAGGKDHPRRGIARPVGDQPGDAAGLDRQRDHPLARGTPWLRRVRRRRCRRRRWHADRHGRRWRRTRRRRSAATRPAPPRAGRRCRPGTTDPARRRSGSRPWRGSAHIPPRSAPAGRCPGACSGRRAEIVVKLGPQRHRRPGQRQFRRMAAGLPHPGQRPARGHRRRAEAVDHRHPVPGPRQPAGGRGAADAGADDDDVEGRVQMSRLSRAGWGPERPPRPMS